MKMIVCIDDNNGILFNKRRVSADKSVTEKILNKTEHGKLWVSRYSAALFETYDANIEVCDDFLDKAEENDYCFIENTDVTNYIDKITEITVYYWNRRYPSDFKFPLFEVLKNKTLVSSAEFMGNSHQKIREEIYK